MTFSTVMQPKDSLIRHILNNSTGGLNIDPIAVSSTSTSTKTSNDIIASVEQIEATSKQVETPSLDRMIFLQASGLPSDFSDFVRSLPSFIENRFLELLTIAKQFNPRATGALIRELYNQKKCDSELLSFYWNNYTPDLPYARALRWWTSIHAAFPSSIVEHLDTFDKKITSFIRFFDAIWFQRNLFPEDVKRSFFAFYWKFLIESNRFSEAKCALLEAKAFLSPQEFTGYFKLLDGKKNKKDSHWAALFKQKFHEALDTKQYEAAAYALTQIGRFLQEGDGGLYFPTLVLTFLKVLRQEEDKIIREDALLQFDRMFASNEAMSHWAGQPPLFADGVILYLKMTKASVETGIIKEISRLQSDLTYPYRDKWTLSFFKYLSQQSHWPQASLPHIKECFTKNQQFLDHYFLQNEDPELLLNMSLLCLQNKIENTFLEKCFEDKLRSILVQRYPEKTRVLIQLYLEEIGLQGSSKIEPVLRMIVLQGKSKEQFSLNKPILEKLLEIEKIVLQNNLSMAKGYAELFDILLENDSSMCMGLLDKLDTISINNFTECYKKYLRALLDGGGIEDAFVFCNTFRNNVNEQEIIPYIQKEQLSAPSPTLEKFILKYMTSFSAELWIRFSLHLYKNNQSDIVIGYFRHTLGCLKKMSANKSVVLTEQELFEMFSLLNVCREKISKISDKSLQQEFFLVVLEYIVRYPLANKEDQIELLDYFQGFSLNQIERKFIEVFRKQAESLSEYNKICENSPVITVLFPEYNELQEVKKMNSISMPEGVQSLFARANYYMDCIENTKVDEVRLQTVAGLSKIISQLLTKNLDNKSKELFQAILNNLMSKHKELLLEKNSYQWLETVFLTPHKSTLGLFQSILDLALLNISEEDVFVFLSEKLSEYMERKGTILDDNIRELLNTGSFTNELRAIFLHKVLFYGCSHIQRKEIKHREEVLFIGIEDDSSGVYLSSCLNAITEYLPLMEKPESFVPLLKQLYEGVAYILVREKGIRILLERKEKQGLIRKFIKKLENYPFKEVVRWEIIKHFIYTFARHLDTAHELALVENKVTFKDALKCVDLPQDNSDQVDEFMQFAFQLEYRSFIDVAINPPRDNSIWSEKAQEAILLDAKHYSQIILEKVEEESFDNLTPYIRCLKLGILKKLNTNNRKAFFDIFKEFMRKLEDNKVFKFPSYVQAELAEIYNRLSFTIKDQLLLTGLWETQDKESFLDYICELARLMGIEAENTYNSNFHTEYRAYVGYIFDAKGRAQKCQNEDLNKLLKKPMMANYLAICYEVLKKFVELKKHNLIELYVKILEDLFAEIKTSETFKKVFKQEEKNISNAMNLYLNARFGNYNTALVRIRLAYLDMMATPKEQNSHGEYLPLEIVDEMIDTSALHFHKEVIAPKGFF